MSAPPTPADVTRFHHAVSRRFGLRLAERSLGELARILQRRLESTQNDPGTYLARLEGRDTAELRHLAPELTVPETFFFRSAPQLRALVEHALPARILARSSERTLRLLSAGCASGEEPYSLAILLRGQFPATADWNVSIRGVDVNPAALEKAARARYSAWSMRGTPVDVQRRWFHVEGRELVLDEAIRALVTFEERNLLEDDPALWAPGTLDVVFCRNVLMYLTREAARDLLARIAASLAPGGFLFLGHAETLRGLSQDFDLRQDSGAFYYQLRPRAPAEDLAARSTPAPVLIPAPALTLSRTPTPVSTPSLCLLPEPRTAAKAPDQFLELLRQERLVEARALVDSLLEVCRLPEVLLLRATLLTNANDLAGAERVCKEILGLDGLSAGAHYLLALCREHNGDLVAATDHGEVATYLNPDFAMPHLHLGRLARRAGAFDVARRKLEKALTLFGQEDPAHILLFGGGFQRQALIALCRSEIAACGGAS